MTDDQDLLFADLQRLKSYDYGAALEAAQSVGVRGHAPVDDNSLDAVVNRLAWFAYQHLAEAHLVYFGALFPKDRTMRACAEVVVKGNFMEVADPDPDRPRRRRPGAAVR